MTDRQMDSPEVGNPLLDDLSISLHTVSTQLLSQSV